MNEYLIECKATSNEGTTIHCVRTRRAPNARAAIESLCDYLKRIEHMELTVVESIMRINPHDLSIVELVES